MNSTKTLMHVSTATGEFEGEFLIPYKRAKISLFFVDISGYPMTSSEPTAASYSGVDYRCLWLDIGAGISPINTYAVALDQGVSRGVPILLDVGKSRTVRYFDREGDWSIEANRSSAVKMNGRVLDALGTLVAVNAHVCLLCEEM